MTDSSNSSAVASASGSTVETVEVPAPALTTSFKDYTVSETLLLLILLTVIVIAIIKFIKGAF